MPKTKTIKKVVFYYAPVSVAGTVFFNRTLQNYCFSSFRLLFQCLTHTEKALIVPLFAAPRKRARTGFYYLCFIYQLFTYHVKRWRGLFGARCGLLSPRDLSPDTHRPSFFYMRTGTYNVLTVAVPCASFLNCAAKVQTYLETTKQKTKNLCLFNVLQQIKLIYAVFIHILSTKLTKCAIYKANFFACRLIYTHIHTYII